VPFRYQIRVRVSDNLGVLEFPLYIVWVNICHDPPEIGPASYFPLLSSAAATFLLLTPSL